MRDPDTIAAIATPGGASGVGIIRVSGPQAESIARRIFRPGAGCKWESHRLYHGNFLTACGQSVLDEGLAVLMRKPRSFTGEDVFEIHAHGNPVILQKLLTELVKAGCRLAAPGEFSRRAFESGRIDLSQAEALASMISARSAAAYSASLAQHQGSLRQAIDSIRRLLIDALAQLEVSIDFDVDIVSDPAPVATPQVDEAARLMTGLIATYGTARLLTDGANVIIAGRPNVGKSSLLNALTGSPKAIVTDIPGTTRDLITHEMELDGLFLRLTDTAGIRPPRDIIEKEGIALVRRELETADAAVVVLDGSRPLTDDDIRILSEIPCPCVVIAVNKSDLPPVWQEEHLQDRLPANTPVIRISAKTGAGLDRLKNTLTGRLTESISPDAKADAAVLNLRHKGLLEDALTALAAARHHLDCNVSPELAAFDLREAVGCLDAITGRRIGDDVLHRIFSGFCIGK